MCDEFFRGYHADYWDYKIALLKRIHDSYETLKEDLWKGVKGVVDEDFKRVLRTEMHFLYFQLVEALFEMIFAICAQEPRYLWARLTFSDWRQNYEKIKLLAERKLDSPDIKRKVKIDIGGKETEVPLLRWIMYFCYPLSLTEEQWTKNLGNIERMLYSFAEDFVDRGDYNAYKHSLRFYNSSFSFALGKTGSDTARVMGSGPDCITFLEETELTDSSGEKHRGINSTMKPFDFERDYRCSVVIAGLIQNMVHTRKYSLLKDFIGKPFDVHKYDGIKLPEFTSKTGVSRFSVPV